MKYYLGGFYTEYISENKPDDSSNFFWAMKIGVLYRWISGQNIGHTIAPLGPKCNPSDWSGMHKDAHLWRFESFEQYHTQKIWASRRV